MPVFGDCEADIQDCDKWVRSFALKYFRSMSGYWDRPWSVFSARALADETRRLRLLPDAPNAMEVQLQVGGSLACMTDLVLQHGWKHHIPLNKFVTDASRYCARPYDTEDEESEDEGDDSDIDESDRLNPNPILYYKWQGGDVEDNFDSHSDAYDDEYSDEYDEYGDSLDCHE